MIQVRSICLSAHLDTFCRRLNELRGLEFCYQTDDPGSMRRRVGWNVEASYANGPISAENAERAKHCELLIEMLREPDLIEQRSKANLPTVYICERWFKPLVVTLPIPLFDFDSRLRLKLPGHLRLLVPSYRKMAKRFAALMDDPNVWFFPCGVHAVRDFVRMYKILHGDICAWFRQPAAAIDRKLAGSVVGFHRLKLWGYFVEPSDVGCQVRTGGHWHDPVRLLWVGRLIRLKRLDVVLRAFLTVKKKKNISLLVVGEGDEREKLMRFAGNNCFCGSNWLAGKIGFRDYMSGKEVRALMRESDVLIFSSNAEDGWGAVVSEALTEGCGVIGTYDTGAAATLLPNSNLYYASNVDELSEKLLHVEKLMCNTNITEWSGAHAAEKILEVTKC